jgi:hypothetical protein
LLASPPRLKLHKSIAAVRRFLVTEPPRAAPGLAEAEVVIPFPRRRKTVASSDADRRLETALGDIADRLGQIETVIRSPARRRLYRVTRILLPLPRSAAQRSRSAPVLRPPTPAPQRFSPRFVQNYPGMGPGQLIGNEILNVAPLAVGDRSGANWFQTTTAQIAALATGGVAIGITSAVYVSNNAVLALPSTQNLVTIIRQGIPAPLTIQLPAGPTKDLYIGVKDGGNNFAANNANVVTTDGTQIDNTPGVTGIVMNFRNQGMSLIFDGTQWCAL